MGLLDVLRKIGVIRYGTYKGTYTSARDMPDELFMENVYDAKKDLIHSSQSTKADTGKMEGGMFCSQCGTQIPQDAKYCPKCGAQTSPGQQAAAPGVSGGMAAAMTPKKKMALWKKLLLGTAAFLVLVIGAALYFTSDLLVPIDAQLAALRSGDVRGAYEQTASAFKQATSYEQFAAFVAAYPSLSKNKEASFSERSWEGSQGHVKGTLTDVSGGVLPVEFRLVKENDQWKILGINLK